MPINKNLQNNLAVDFWVIVVSIIAAVSLVRTGVLPEVLSLTKDFWFLNAFIAGVFFTSVFTTAPSIAALGEIAQSSSSVWPVALWGGLGALCGDLVIFQFMRDRVGKDVVRLAGNAKNIKVRHIFKLKFFRWLTFFLGALIIASPFPDEIGLAMIGMSKAKTSLFVVASFISNSLGILAIGLIAQSLAGT